MMFTRNRSGPFGNRFCQSGQCNATAEGPTQRRSKQEQANGRQGHRPEKNNNIKTCKKNLIGPEAQPMNKTLTKDSESRVLPSSLRAKRLAKRWPMDWRPSCVKCWPKKTRQQTTAPASLCANGWQKALSLTWQKTRAYKGSVINSEKENNKKLQSNLTGSKLVDEGGPSVTLTASCPVLVRHPGVVVPGLDPFAPLLLP